MTARPLVESIREFAHRDRRELQALKRSHWAEQHRRMGPAETLRVGWALYEHARRVQPQFPDPRARQADLEDHITLKRKLDRVASAFAVR